MKLKGRKMDQKSNENTLKIDQKWFENEPKTVKN